MQTIDNVTSPLNRLSRQMTTSLDERVQHYEAVIHGFLRCDDALNGGRAAWLWPRVLSLCYPVLATRHLVHQLLSLVLRGLRNQPSVLHDFAEIFAGKAWLTYELLAGGFVGSGFDIGFSAAHNCLDSKGMRLILDCVATVKQFGLVWIACPCSSFTIMCRHQSQRLPENSWLGIGAESFQFVKEGNSLMELSSLVYFVCYLLSVWVVLEQPNTSCLPQCPSFKGVLHYTRSARFVTYMGAYGGPTVKPLQLMTTWNSIRDLVRAKPELGLSSDLVERDGDSGAFTGNRELLRESQMYTQSFGKAVTEICQREWQRR